MSTLWTKLHADFCDHPKTYDLAVRLGAEHADAVLLLLRLWNKAKAAKRFSKRDVSRLAALVEWPHHTSRDLVKALIGTGWLDEGLCGSLNVHNALRYGGDFVARKRQRMEKDRDRKRRLNPEQAEKKRARDRERMRRKRANSADVATRDAPKRPKINLLADPAAENAYFRHRYADHPRNINLAEYGITEALLDEIADL